MKRWPWQGALVGAAMGLLVTRVFAAWWLS